MSSRSGRMARRASAMGASVLMVIGGLVATAPTAPAAPITPTVTGTTAPAGAGGSVAVGYGYSCALTSAGGVKCWGDNYYGQLGDGTRTSRRRPVDVVGLTSGVVQVSANTQTTCAVTRAGGVKCWGAGNAGELGNGTSDYATPTPVDVVGLSTGVASVSVGRTVTCAVTVAGAAKCWGSNVTGGLGSGGNGSNVPVDVRGLGSGVRAIATGIEGACALTADGVQCWGYNGYGEIGDGVAGSWEYFPVAALGLRADTVAISGTQASRCALTDAGRILCWGNNGADWLGVHSRDSLVLAPRLVAGLYGVKAVSNGDLTTCALQTHRAWCWGENSTGAVGDGTTTGRTTPVPVVGLPGQTVDIATNAGHTCARSATGVVSCWGDNSRGQLGNGTKTASTVPVRVVGVA